jgi:hypothetical protein
MCSSDQEYFYSSAAYSVIYNGHAEGRPINSVFYKLNLKDLKIHNKLPLFFFFLLICYFCILMYNNQRVFLLIFT